MKHEMHLAKEPFDKIANGTKTIESRLYDDKRRSIAVGDDIEFRKNGEPARSVVRRVVALHVYPTFNEMMRDLPPARFGWTNTEESIEDIGRFYTLEDQAKFGVVGIQLG